MVDHRVTVSVLVVASASVLYGCGAYASNHDLVVAEAGDDQIVNENILVNVTAQGSVFQPHHTYPPNFDWVQLSGPPIVFDDDGAFATNFTSPYVQGNATVRIKLFVVDGFSREDDDTVSITIHDTVNIDPVADAGDDQSALEGQEVTLNGTGSSDRDWGTVLTYNWTQTVGPTVTLSNRTAAMPTFTSPSVTGNTNITFSLAVSDGSATDTDTVLVTVVDNKPPVVDAGPDQIVIEGQRFTVNGTATDPEGHTPLTYSWTTNSTLFSTFLSAQTPLITTLIAPSVSADTPILSTLTATDSRGAAASDTMVVTILNNLPPVVDAGPDLIVPEGSLVTLNGTATDPEGHTPLTYDWQYSEQSPGQPPISIDDHTAIDTTFIAPQVTGNTTYTFTLGVYDRYRAWGAGSMEITIYDVPNQPPVVDAGPDKSATEGDPIVLEGSATDPEGHTPITYLWTHNSTLSINLNNDTNPISGLIAPILPFPDDTPILFNLTATDSLGAAASDTALVTVLYNRPPLVDIGPNQVVPEGSLVTLSANATDPEGHTPLKYRWDFGFLGNRPPPDLSGADTPTVTFTAPPVTANTTYSVGLFVSDSRGATAVTSVSITVYNVPSPPPIVDAGGDQTVYEGDGVTLNGTATDPEGEDMTYLWSCEAFSRSSGAVTIDLDESPTGTSVTFTAPADVYSPRPFIADDALAFTCTFTATDIHGESASDTMTLIIRDMPDTSEDGPVLTLIGASRQTVQAGSTYIDPGATCVTLHDGTPLTVTTAGEVDTGARGTQHIEYSCEHNGRHASATRSVTVLYNTSPTIGITSVRTAIGAGDGSTDYGSDATCTDREDGGLLVTSSVSFNGDGTATITYSCTDSSGRSARTTQEVAVTSSSPPGIYLNGPGIYHMNAGDTWTDPGAYCIDAEDGRIPARVTHSSVDTTKPGHYTVGYSCTDTDGNSEGMVRNILVQPSHQNLPPSLSVGSRAVTVPVNGTLSLPGATCMDKEDGDLTHLIWLYGVENVDTTRAGTYDVFYFCTDSGDEQAQAYLRVVVGP